MENEKNIKTPHETAAEEYFYSGHNCAQSVLAAFSDMTGISERDSFRLGSALGGGLCGRRETCGAVLAMLAVLGSVTERDITDHEEKKKLYADGRELVGKFIAKFDTKECAGLLRGFELKSEPSERTPEYYRKRPCSRFIGGAARLLDEYFESCYEKEK